jgi:hypothetical protein
LPPLSGEPTQQEVAAAASVRTATNLLKALRIRRGKALKAAVADEAAAAPPPAPDRQDLSDDDRDDRDRWSCLRVRRLGRIDRKGRLLNSNDSKDAFGAAHRNAVHMPWPLELCPRSKPIIQSGGERKCNAVGMPLSYSQAGTNFAENVFGRIERTLSSKAGYHPDFASLLAGEFASMSNTAARRDYLGELNVGHNKLYMLEQINSDYEAVGEPPFYPWRVEPDVFDPSRRYWAAYDKQQHPEFYKDGPPPPPPPPPTANAPLPPVLSQLVSHAGPRVYRVTAGGPDVALPSESWMLAQDIERANDKMLPCPCPRIKSASRTMKDRKHPLPYCLHGIVLRLQQSHGGGARRGASRRDRRSG